MASQLNSILTYFIKHSPHIKPPSPNISSLPIRFLAPWGPILFRHQHECSRFHGIGHIASELVAPGYNMCGASTCFVAITSSWGKVRLQASGIAHFLQTFITRPKAKLYALQGLDVTIMELVQGRHDCMNCQWIIGWSDVKLQGVYTNPHPTQKLGNLAYILKRPSGLHTTGL